MSSILRKHDITNLFLVVGGGLMIFFNLSAMAYRGYNPWDPWLIWGDGNQILSLLLSVIEGVGSMGGIFIIVLSYMWNKEHNPIFAFVVSFFAVFNICAGIVITLALSYGLSFGILIVFGGLLVLLGGAAKYDRYTKILALGTHMSAYDEQGSLYDEQGGSEETQAQSEIQETEGEVGPVILDRSTKYCASCATRITVDAIFCIECGTSQETH